MSDEGKQHRSKEAFWAIPRGTMSFEPAGVVKLKPAEYARRVAAENAATLNATAEPKPITPATTDDMIKRLGELQ